MPVADPPRKSRDAGKTRARICEAALALFVEQGIAETTTRDIARGAEVAEGTLYRHFESKEELSWALYADIFLDLGARVQQIESEYHRFEDQWRALVRLLCALYDSRPYAFRYLLLTQHNHLRRVTPEMNSPIEAFRALVLGAMERREIAAQDPDLATAFAIGLIVNTATFIVYHQLEGPMARWAADLEEAGLRVLLGIAAPEGEKA